MLKVPDEYLGMRGRCNKCGARIALIGQPGSMALQAATRVEESEIDDLPSPPATEKQLDYLRALGARDHEFSGLDRERASELIERLKAQERDRQPPSEKQLAYLERLGTPPEQLTAITSRKEASDLIDAIQPPPTDKQLALLKKLGADAAQCAALQTRREASELIEMLQTQAPPPGWRG
jgi:hypothetical protein